MPTATRGEPLRPEAKQILLHDEKTWVDDSASVPLSASALTQVTVENVKELLPVQEQGVADVWADREVSGQLLRAVFIAAFENGYRDLGLVVQTADGPRRLPFEAVANQSSGDDIRVNLHQRQVKVSNQPSASYDVEGFAKSAHELFAPDAHSKGRPAGNVTVLFSKDTSTGTVATVLGTLHQARSSVDEGTRRTITFSIPQKQRDRVVLGTPQVNGRLSADVVAEYVNARLPEFEKCYELGLQENPELRGTVRVRFVIGRQGIVANSNPAGDFGDAKVSGCLARVLYGASFPAPEGGNVMVEVPIVLSP